MIEQEIIERIKTGEPFKGLSDIRIRAVEPQPKGLDPNIRPDVAITMEFTGTTIALYGEIKTQVTRKILEETGRLLARSNVSKTDIRYVLICPFLSPENQKYCQENQIDFIDLCGNILIRMPGKVFIQRLNQPNLFKTPQLLRNPFGGVSSRVLRVLLNDPNRRWLVNDIYQELMGESLTKGREKYFQISLSSISKTIDSLEESLLVRRDGMKILVPDPKQLLFRWAEKYQERYKWMRRSSWLCKNPFGFDVKSSIKGLYDKFSDAELKITGSAAASLTAPFVNIDRIDVFILNNNAYAELRGWAEKAEPGKGPDFLFFIPYDEGVAMYSQIINGVTTVSDFKTYRNGITTVSDVQAYLDCYAQGGRDAKQAEYLLTNIIEKQWNKK